MNGERVGDRPEAELVAALSGDGWGPALAELWDRHLAVLRGVAFAVTRDADGVEDVLADTLAALAERAAAGSLTGISSFRAYAVTAVRNTAYGRARRAGRMELTGDTFEATPDRAPAHADRLVDQADQRYVAAAFASLPDNYREVLWLVEVEGMPPREVAGIIGTSANNVSQLAHRARVALREGWVAAHLRDLSGASPCAEISPHLPAHLAGTLRADRVAGVDQHLAGCASCSVLHASLRDDTARLRGLLPLAAPGCAFAALAAKLGIGSGMAVAAAAKGVAAAGAGAAKGVAAAGAAKGVATAGAGATAGVGTAAGTGAAAAGGLLGAKGVLFGAALAVGAIGVTVGGAVVLDRSDDSTLAAIVAEEPQPPATTAPPVAAPQTTVPPTTTTTVFVDPVVLLSSAPVPTGCLTGLVAPGVTSGRMTEGVYLAEWTDPGSGSVWTGARRVNPRSLAAPAVGDFNGDGIVEVAAVSTCNQGGSQSDFLVDVWQQGADGLTHLGEWYATDYLVAPTSVRASGDELVLGFGCVEAAYCSGSEESTLEVPFRLEGTRFVPTPSPWSACQALQQIPPERLDLGLFQSALVQGLDQVVDGTVDLAVVSVETLDQGGDGAWVALDAASGASVKGPAWALGDRWQTADPGIPFIGVTVFDGRLACGRFLE